jgi:2-keto-4-pentenoate hydratase/2-oxohepta-3-ene-1,7-dioic acid hydratase in catechol pathway
LQAAAAASPHRIGCTMVSYLPPVVSPPSIFCIGLNYVDHATEAGLEVPDFPTVFSRYTTSLCGHGDPIIRPRCSDSLDYEAELAVVIGKGGRHISREHALDHVFGYSLFNDGSVREYQAKGSQWTLGKNFDFTGAFGPFVVTADELPAGAEGLKIELRLNGETMQAGSTTDMVFGVPALIETLSRTITLRPGDVIATGTPAGIGWTRSPKVIMRDGDECEVAIEGIGSLFNYVQDERA